VPYFDYIVFRSDKLNRALLNLGGIANITLLKSNCTVDNVIAFDTGPANMLIDFAVKRFFNKKLDTDGEIAESGKFDENLFNALVIKDHFIEAGPPKSTGREYYGESFISPLLDEFSSVPHEDWLNTLTNFTVYGIYRNYEKYLKKECELDELIISGGGAKNLFLLKLLKEKFGQVEVKAIDEIGVSSDAKEAICFAVLANETISGNHSNIPRATGASRSTILGKICLP
jgi:anhydro-N-acetylmuramic acid kinase